jgi:hypothetical protein
MRYMERVTMPFLMTELLAGRMSVNLAVATLQGVGLAVIVCGASVAKGIALYAELLRRFAPLLHVALHWAQRLKRVFGIEIEACARYVARLKIVASIEDPGVIVRILAHRDRASGRAQPERALHAARAPPGQSAV